MLDMNIDCRIDPIYAVFCVKTMTVLAIVFFCRLDTCLILINKKIDFAGGKNEKQTFNNSCSNYFSYQVHLFMEKPQEKKKVLRRTRQKKQQLSGYCNM